MKFRAPRAIRRLRVGLAVAATVALGSIGLAAAQAVPASAATACSVTYSVSSQWSTGFSVSITITNTGDPLTSWSLGYSYSGNQQLTQGWSGNWTQSGENVTATSASWNGSLATNASTQIGANFSYSGTNTAPTAFTVNGTACNGSNSGGGTTPGSILASSSSLSVAQGSSATFGLSLSSAPASNVAVSVGRASGNTGLSVSTGSSLTFTPSNYATAQNVTIAADSASTGAATFTISATGYTPVSVTVTETSNSGGGTTATHVADPFTGAKSFLDPEFTKQVSAQASADGNNAAEAAVANYPTAYWLDTICSIAGGSPCNRLGLQTELSDAAAEGTSSTPAVIEIVVYDLPGRDCAALASNGEIPATSAGLTEYESQYIDPIASTLSQFENDNLRVVAIIEPDSLPNVVTNQSKSACQTATPYYEQGTEYALNKLHAIPNVYNYLDIAHSAWLGWPNNMSATPAVYNTVVKGTTAGYDSIDGFISDTANYTPVQEPFLTNPTMSVGGQPLDSANFYQYNPTFDEQTYDTDMYNTLVSAGFPSSKRFLIDTSRDGWGGPNRPTSLNSSPTDVNSYVAANKIDQRPFRGDWCNINGAGIGARPQDEPFGASSPIEAYVWIKPPGFSDGDYPTSTHSHGDPHCDPNGTQTDGNGGTYPTDAIPGYDVPAGQWFPAEFQMLVKNAYPAL